MPDKDMINWMQDQQRKGFSDNQIKQALIGQGYAKEKIEGFFSSNNKNASKSKYAIFYILFTIINPILIILTFAIPFLTINGAIIYISTFLYAAIIGFISAYIFYKNCDSTKEYVNHTLASSIILAIILAVINLVGEVGIKLTQSFKNISQGEETAGAAGSTLLTLFNSQAISNNILHIIALIIFILPIIYYFMKQEDKQMKLLAFYMMPLAVYLLLILVLGLINNAVLSPIR